MLWVALGTQKNRLNEKVLLSIQNLYKLIDEKKSQFYAREHSGSVVECLTRDRGAAASSLTSVTVLWSLSKTHLS